MQIHLAGYIYLIETHCLLPPGAVGELYLAGIQVSNGYIDLPSENAKSFLTDSILPSSGQRMYKTGDYAYWDSQTGEVCILGRRDRQIKLHGFRLDLDDLETCILKAVPGCGGVAVFLCDDYLVAAYQISSNIPDFTPDELQVRMLISYALLPYAMPRRLIAVSNFPLTAAGKLDYRKLKEMDNARAAGSQILAKSMTKTEAMIVGAVRDLMKLGLSIPIDQDSDLTGLGGDSVLQLRLASRISSLLRRRFPVRNVIDYPIISQLATSVDRFKNKPATWDEDSHQMDHATTRIASRNSSSKVSPIERYWFSRYQKNL